MAEKNNATCSICGKAYHKCLSCRDEIQAKPWKTYTDTPECYKVFQVVRGYSIGVYDVFGAYDKFQNIDLSELEDFRDNIKEVIKSILKDGKPKQTRKKSVVDNVIADNCDLITSQSFSETIVTAESDMLTDE